MVVYLKPRRHRAPIINAEFCKLYIYRTDLISTGCIILVNGEREWINCANDSREEIIKWLYLLRGQSGTSLDMRLRKLWHTDHPSIQGPWTPYTFRDPTFNLATFPNEELSQSLNRPKSATQQLLEIFKSQQPKN